jgi:hypothetical protein
MKNNKEKKEKASVSSVTDSLKKIMSAGSASDISKELLQTALNQVNKTKDDVSAKVTNEMIALIRKIDFVKEFSKFAEDHKFKISAEVEIIKKDK